MEPSFPPGMLKFNHRLAPVASFAPPAGTAAETPPTLAPTSDGTFKKEPAAPRAAFPAQRTPGGFLQSPVSIKQDKPAEPEDPPGAPLHQGSGGLFAGADERAAGTGEATASSRT